MSIKLIKIYWKYICNNSKLTRFLIPAKELMSDISLVLLNIKQKKYKLTNQMIILLVI